MTDSGLNKRFFLLGDIDCEIYATARIGDADLGDLPNTFRMGLAMDCLNLVFTSRNILDGERTILLGNCEMGMLNESNIREHPRMHIAFEAQKYFRFVP